MKRLRFFRVLLPVLLVVLGGLLVFSLTPRDRVIGRPGGPLRLDDQPRAEGLEFFELKGGERSVSGLADLVSEAADGRLHLEGIRGLQIERPARGPVVVDALRGDGAGAARQRLWRFEDEVVLRDPEARLRLSLPSLEVDEVHGEARSQGEVRFEGPQVEGRASRLVYSLAGQPGTLLEPRIENADGARLSALNAVLYDGIRDVELRDSVEAERAGARLNTARLRVVRNEQGGVRKATAEDGLVASWPSGAGTRGTLVARKLDLDWSDSGELLGLALRGDVRIEREADRLAAGEVEAERRPGGAWEVHARHAAALRVALGGKPGELYAEEIVAQLTADRGLSAAEALGQVRFDSVDLHGEAARASLETSGGGERIQLHSDGRRKATLARENTRVAADWIRTDLAGLALLAQGRVEATLLPEGRESALPRPAHLFRADEAIHFVAARLEGRDRARRLEFSGMVRGWQGERNLAAETIVVDQATRRIEARTAVSSRFPRASDGSSVAASDFVQIGADRLEYDEAARRVAYSGEVRLQIAEGWLESAAVEVDLGVEGGEVREVRASGAVRLEFLASASEANTPPMSGVADRVTYLPGENTVMLYGDRAPATVSRGGGARATSSGRALRYRLDLGTLEVEAGEQGPAQIRTAGNGP